MKKILLVVVVFVSSFAQAQQEIKADLFDALAFKTLELSYEYYTTERSSIGISALFNFEKDRLILSTTKSKCSLHSSVIILAIVVTGIILEKFLWE